MVICVGRTNEQKKNRNKNQNERVRERKGRRFRAIYSNRWSWKVTNAFVNKNPRLQCARCSTALVAPCKRAHRIEKTIRFSVLSWVGLKRITAAHVEWVVDAMQWVEQSKIYDYCVLFSISFEFELNACRSAHCLTIFSYIKTKLFILLLADYRDGERMRALDII